MTKEDRTIKRDRFRYTKNSLSSGLALLAILFDVFYFVSIYKSDAGNYYYQYMIGLSILYNLVFMLVVFLCSEGVKKYNLSYAVTLVVVGLLQIARIFILPKDAHAATVVVGGEEAAVMGDAQFTRVIVYLAVSAALCVLAGLVGIVRNRMLVSYEKELAAKAVEA